MRQKITTRVEQGVIARVKAAAVQDGRTLESIIEEALRAWLDQRGGPRGVGQELQASLEQNRDLYRRLAE